MSDHPTCGLCHKKIFDAVVSAGDLKYHDKCFVCSSCQKPFGNSQYVQRGNQNLCTRCNETACFVCGHKLTDYFVKDGHKVHPHCLKCDRCTCALPDGEFFTFGGKTLCQSCYTAAQAAQPQPVVQPRVAPAPVSVDPCEKCGRGIEGPNLLVKGKKYHQGCFKCEACGNVIPAGVQFFNVELGRNPVGVSSILCSTCNLKLCPKCLNPILAGEKFVTHQGKQLHEGCLRCVECGLSLDPKALHMYEELLCCEVHWKAFTMGLLKRRPYAKHTKQ